MKSTRSSDMAVSLPRVSRPCTSRGPRTHLVRSVVSDEFAVLDRGAGPAGGCRPRDQCDWPRPKEVQRKSKAITLVFEELGRCALCNPRRKLAATTTYRGGSSHDQLPTPSHRDGRRDSSPSGGFCDRPCGGAPSRSRPGAASQQRIPRLTSELSVASDRPSTCTVRQPHRSRRDSPTIHPGTRNDRTGTRAPAPGR